MGRHSIHRLKDPFYVGLIFQIEQMICSADEEAKEAGWGLNDSQLQSALVKAHKLVKGAARKIPESSDRDRLLSKLIRSLHDARECLLEECVGDDGIAEQRPLRRVDWANALETVIDSIKRRKGGVSGSRAYLDFLPEFLASARDEH